MPHSNSATLPQPVSTGQSLNEQIEILESTQTAFCTWASDRLEEFRHTSGALLHAAREHQSRGNAHAAQTALAQVRADLDRVIGPSRVRSIQ